jgi:hypothetical protein
MSLLPLSLALILSGTICGRAKGGGIRLKFEESSQPRSQVPLASSPHASTPAAPMVRVHWAGVGQGSTTKQGT